MTPQLSSDKTDFFFFEVIFMVHSAVTVEYSDCISAVG